MFSVVDVVGAVTGAANPRRYWSDVKRRMKNGGLKGVRVARFKLRTKDGRFRETDIADSKNLARIISALPGRRGDGVKEWLGRVKPGDVVEMLPQALVGVVRDDGSNGMLLINDGGAGSVCAAARRDDGADGVNLRSDLADDVEGLPDVPFNFMPGGRRVKGLMTVPAPVFILTRPLYADTG
jgi:hypothetical protein